MRKKPNDFFWPSFTDVMTSLFFVMLILYVLTYINLRVQQQVTETQLAKIREIDSAVRELPAKYFTYQPVYKRFLLNQQIQFGKYEFKIPDSSRNYLLNVGRSLNDLMIKLKTKYAGDSSIRIAYLIVVEGMASNDTYDQNDELSYQRAHSLFKLWEGKQIIFDTTFCDLQIAGSGTRGLGRFTGPDEYLNQRFLIQIIPKIKL